MSLDPMKDPVNFMRWKQKQFGTKGKPLDLFNESHMPASAISCSRDATVWVNGGFFICRDCYERLCNKSSIMAKFTLTPTPNVCKFCGKRTYAAFYVYAIAVTLAELYGILGGHQGKYLKIDGDRVVKGARWKSSNFNKKKTYYI